MKTWNEYKRNLNEDSMEDYVPELKKHIVQFFNLKDNDFTVKYMGSPQHRTEHNYYVMKLKKAGTSGLAFYEEQIRWMELRKHTFAINIKVEYDKNFKITNDLKKKLLEIKSELGKFSDAITQKQKIKLITDKMRKSLRWEWSGEVEDLLDGIEKYHKKLFSTLME